MKKRTRFKFHLSDFFIVFVCLSLCALSLYLFWRDLNKSSVRNDKNRIATIYFKQRIAQRKFNDRVVWERLSQSSPLYNEDTIRTADLAQAVIRFNNGTELNLGENTMLQLSYDEKEGLQIAVSGGDIQVDGTKSNGENGLSLKMKNGSVVQLDSGSRVALKTDFSGSSQNIEVQSGSALLITESAENSGGSKNGKSSEKTMRISSGENLNVDSDGKISKNPIAVTSIPKNLNLLKMDEKPVSVKLEWNVAEKKSADSAVDTEVIPAGSDNNENFLNAEIKAEKLPEIIIQTSETKDFSRIKATYRTTKDDFEIPAVSGTLYWRVFKEGNEEQSVDGKINVKEIPEIALISPESGSEFIYRTSLPKILFNWSGNDYASNYKIEISENRDMSNPVLSEENIELNSILKNELSEGTYYWRVIPFYTLNNIGSGKPSEIKSFTIVKSENIKPPLLTMPVDEAEISYVESKNPEKSYNLNFFWKSEIKNADYEFEIARDKNFSDIFYSEKTKNSFVSKKLGILSSWVIPDGTYFWRVTRKSGDDDDITPVSAIQSFSIKKLAADKTRLVYPPENFSSESEYFANTKFIWRLSDDFIEEKSKTVLQVSKKEDFSALCEEISGSDGSARIAENSLSAGTYYWRVGVKTSDGLEAVSDVRTFTILQKLLPPKIVLPLENSTLLTYSEKPTLITWQKTDGADYYNVKLFDEKGILVAEKVGIKQLNAKFVLPAEKYSVQIQAAAEQTETNPLRTSGFAESSFVLRNPSPIRAVSPISMKISGLAALRNPTVFSWQNGADIPAKTEFVLYKVLANGNVREVYSQKNAKSGFSAERLGEGTYRWCVRASTSDGIPLDSEEQTFEITKVPLLPEAVLLQPEQNFVVGTEYLRKNRSIIFSWENVPGASDYKFSLYKKNSDGSLKFIYAEKTKKNQVKFKDLKKLEIADFEWNVTAFSHASDGFEEQSGFVSAGEFKIDYKKPEKIKLVKPGKMYAE